MTLDQQPGKHDSHVVHTANDATPASKHTVRLPRFMMREDVGLGDVVKRMTSAVGVTPCGGCQQRAARLNRWIGFTPGR